jgi:hypothetical protein
MTRFNPVAKNNKGKGGPFKDKNKDGRSYRNQKIKKELEELDRKYIETEVDEYKTDRDDS